MQRKVILYIAASLDGYIADKGGGVGWLDGREEGDGYSSFIREIDTVLMGWNTYRQIITELSPGSWIYSGLDSYVFTHRQALPQKGVAFTSRTPGEVVRKLKQEKGKDIWLCGGGQLIQSCMEEGVIDEYRISVIPVVLGAGIPLFGGHSPKTELYFAGAAARGQIAELTYIRK